MSIIAVAIIFTLIPVAPFASGRSAQVRDRYCNPVETKEKQGNETTVRDRDGNITRTERFEDQGRKSIRDKQGNLIGTEDTD
jgi:YD repeat-containing protein